MLYLVRYHTRFQKSPCSRCKCTIPILYISSLVTLVTIAGTVKVNIRRSASRRATFCSELLSYMELQESKNRISCQFLDSVPVGILAMYTRYGWMQILGPPGRPCRPSVSINPKPTLYNILCLERHVIITSTMMLLFYCFTQQQSIFPCRFK